MKYTTFIATVLFFVFFTIVPCFAGTYDDGVSAFNSKDFKTAYKILSEEANKGNMRAQFWVGYMYVTAQGVPKDYKEAAKWYRLAADQGYAPAQRNLGGFYYYGDGVERDYKEAIKWNQLAAEQGDIYAQTFLGLTYSNKGLGVPHDEKESAKWYRLAAEQGDKNSQYILARMAADQGDSNAQFHLSLMYSTGEGVPKDEIQGYAWLFIAAANVNMSAIEYFNYAIKEMTSAQITQAEERMKEILEKPN